MTEKARGGHRPGAGRKPGSTSAEDPRSEQMAQRYTKHEAQIIREAADKAGETLSGYVRGSALERALLDLVGPPEQRVHESAGRTAGDALRAAMDRGATHIRRLVRPGGSGLYLAEFETRPGCEPVRFPGEE